MKFCTKLAVASLVTAMAAVSAVQAQEKKIKREDLPPAVEKTVAKESKGATIRGFATEMEKGKKIYEAELVVNGRGKDISMDENGKIIEVEEEVPMDSLPAAVQEGFKKAAGSGTIDKVESVTKDGKLAFYEAIVKNGAKHTEVQIAPDGKQISH